MVCPMHCTGIIYQTDHYVSWTHWKNVSLFFLNWKHSEGSPHCKILLKAVKEQVTKDTYRGELGCIKKEKERSGTELAESPMYKESKEKCWGRSYPLGPVPNFGNNNFKGYKRREFNTTIEGSIFLFWENVLHNGENLHMSHSAPP